MFQRQKSFHEGMASAMLGTFAAIGKGFEAVAKAAAEAEAAAEKRRQAARELYNVATTKGCTDELATIVVGRMTRYERMALLSQLKREMGE